MSIDTETRRGLRGLAHPLKPIVTVAERGLEASVLAEIERALSDHELIKVKLAIADRDARAATAGEIVAHLGAEAIASIGKVLALFRANPRAKAHLSNLIRQNAGALRSSASAGVPGPATKGPSTKKKAKALAKEKALSSEKARRSALDKAAAGTARTPSRPERGITPLSGRSGSAPRRDADTAGERPIWATRSPAVRSGAAPRAGRPGTARPSGPGRARPAGPGGARPSGLGGNRPSGPGRPAPRTGRTGGASRAGTRPKRPSR